MYVQGDSNASVHTIHQPDVGSMLVQRRRLWPKVVGRGSETQFQVGENCLI